MQVDLENIPYANKIHLITDMVDYQAKHRPRKTAIELVNKKGDVVNALTYSELQAKSQDLARILTQRSLQGERVLLMYEQTPEFMIGFLGCVYAGAIAVPVSPPASDATIERLSNIIDDCDPAAALCSRKIYRALAMLGVAKRIDTIPVLNKVVGHLKLSQIPQFDHIPFLITENIKPKSVPYITLPELNKSDIAFLQYTSGSTDNPKGIMVTHEALIANEQIIQKATLFDSEGVVVSWLPLFHDMGLIGSLLQSIYVGSTVALIDPLDFIGHPKVWLDTISKYSAEGRKVASGGPDFAFEVCVNRLSDSDVKKLHLYNWDIAFTGAEPIVASTLNRFAKKFISAGFDANAIQPMFGMAEITLMVSAADVHQGYKSYLIKKDDVKKGKVRLYRWKEGARAENEIEVVSCGHTYLDQEVIIVDPVTKERKKPFEIGEVWIKSPSVCKGYWHDEQRTRQVFECYTKDDVSHSQGPYVRDGDLGFMSEEGELFSTGRLKDAMVIEGHNYYPTHIEAIIGFSHSQLRKGCTAAFSVLVDGIERLVVLQEVKSSAVEFDEIAQAIRNRIMAHFQIEPYEISLIPPRNILKTTSGKLRRSRCKQLYEEAFFEILALKTARKRPSKRKSNKANAG